MSTVSSLKARLTISHLVLVAFVAIIGLISVRLLTPVLYRRGLGNGLGLGQAGEGQGVGGPASSYRLEVQDAYNDALTQAVIIAALTGLVAAMVLSALFSRRILRHLEQVQLAARRLAAGDYGQTMEVPSEPELADLATSINTLAASLASTEETRTQLMSDVAHELRNPLTTIEGYMEGLIDGVLPPTVETYTEVAQESRRLRRLTEDLSFLSRSEEGSVRYNMVPMDLAQLARTTAERIRPLLAEAGIELEVELGEPIPVVADTGRLAQALSNLLANALAHTPHGGTVRVSGQSEGDRALLMVSDTGDGIEAGQLEIIFERFTRFRQGPGLGIGLNIARSIARGHGGTLRASSKGVDQGAVFTLSIPLLLAHPGTTAAS